MSRRLRGRSCRRKKGAATTRPHGRSRDSRKRRHTSRPASGRARFHRGHGAAELFIDRFIGDDELTGHARRDTRRVLPPLAPARRLDTGCERLSGEVAALPGSRPEPARREAHAGGRPKCQSAEKRQSAGRATRRRAKRVGHCLIEIQSTIRHLAREACRGQAPLSTQAGLMARAREAGRRPRPLPPATER
jgi:hypothetical protein